MKHKASKSSKGSKASGAGPKLREIREGRGLTMRDVHAESRAIASKHGHRGFEMVPSRLHMLENDLSTPSVYRLYSLSTIYGLSVKELFGMYGLKLTK